MNSPDLDLKLRLEKAEEAVRARDDFIAIAGHELRSPMNALGLQLSYLEALAATQSSDRLAAEVRRAQRMVDRYVRRATVLLDVTRLTSGELKPARTAVPIRALVDTVLDVYSDEAAHHAATLAATVECDAVGQWDAHMAEEILCNLVSNALKYGRGSPVTLKATVEQNAACFEVQDGGPGLTPTQQARLFEKFERLVSPEARQGGFGLGLWIVGKMVAAHEGTIDVQSAPGAGCVFRVRLPLRADPPLEDLTK